MYIRLEKIQKTHKVLIIDELGKFVGEVDEDNLFMKCKDVVIYKDTFKKWKLD